MDFHFAGINGRALAEHTKGQDVLVSFADLRNAGTWAWMRPLLESGHWNSVILDSGSFTVYAAQMNGKPVPPITVEAFAAFAAENGHLFSWIANMDDIGGQVDVSNRNFETLVDAGLGGKVVPVWHEGESDEQLAHVIDRARETGVARIAVGMQRPKGSLVPRNVVACLTEVMPKIRSTASDIAVHGFGLTRYASADTCPCDGPGWAFESVDSTTWIAEACAVQRSGACGAGQGKVERIAARGRAFRVTVDSYQGVDFIGGRVEGPRHGDAFDVDVAAVIGQARTVARRHARIAKD